MNSFFNVKITPIVRAQRLSSAFFAELWEIKARNARLIIFKNAIVSLKKGE
jgi:hypothetical protein